MSNHLLTSIIKIFSTAFSSGAIDYGTSKKDGGHDHRTNKGSDRTPSQQEGDKKRRKSD